MSREIGASRYDTKEEVSFNKNDAGFNSGRDYGWSRREGTVANPVPGEGGPSPGSLNPIYERSHNDFNSITGGYVYRGPVPELQGKYFFADFVTGKIVALNFDRDTDPAAFNGSTAGITNVTDMTAALNGRITGGGGPIRFPVSFGEDHAGNLYVIKFGDGFFPPLGTGEIYQIVVPEPAGLALAPAFALGALLLRRMRRASVREFPEMS